MDVIKKYELVPIRCKCNTPIAHLHEDFKTLLELSPESTDKIFDQLGVKNVCCRASLAFPVIRIIDKPKEDVIAGNNSVKQQESKITRITVDDTSSSNHPNLEIYKESKPCVPISYRMSAKTKKLNNELIANYVEHHTYLAY